MLCLSAHSLCFACLCLIVSACLGHAGFVHRALCGCCYFWLVCVGDTEARWYVLEIKSETKYNFMYVYMYVYVSLERVSCGCSSVYIWVDRVRAVEARECL